MLSSPLGGLSPRHRLTRFGDIRHFLVLHTAAAALFDALFPLPLFLTLQPPPRPAAGAVAGGGGWRCVFRGVPLSETLRQFEKTGKWNRKAVQTLRVMHPNAIQRFFRSLPQPHFGSKKLEHTAPNATLVNFSSPQHATAVTGYRAAPPAPAPAPVVTSTAYAPPHNPEPFLFCNAVISPQLVTLLRWPSSPPTTALTAL